MEKIDIVKLANGNYVIRRIKYWLKIFKCTEYLQEVYRCSYGQDFYHHYWHYIDDRDDGYGGIGSYYESNDTQFCNEDIARSVIARYKKQRQEEEEAKAKKQVAHAKARTIVEVIPEN